MGLLGLKFETKRECKNKTIPLMFFIIHSKYFPDSDWLKAHV